MQSVASGLMFDAKRRTCNPSWPAFLNFDLLSRKTSLGAAAYSGPLCWRFPQQVNVRVGDVPIYIRQRGADDGNRPIFSCHPREGREPLSALHKTPVPLAFTEHHRYKSLEVRIYGPISVQRHGG